LSDTFNNFSTLQTEPVDQHIVGAVKKSKLEKEYKHHQVDIQSKSRLQHQLVAKLKRYRVTSQKRDLETEKKDSNDTGVIAGASSCVDSDKENQDSRFCVYDIEEDGEDLSVISQVFILTLEPDTLTS
jgi:hypothetical protein